MMAANLKLDNLVAFMDFNDFGGLERMSDGHPAFYPLVEKAEAFGWEAVEVDGHDEEAMREAVTSRRGGRPMLVVCRTVKGKGVSYMENVADLALPVAQQGRISTGPQGTGGSAAMRNRFRRHVLRAGQGRSAAVRGRRRYFAGRLDRQVPQRVPATASSIPASPSRS